MARYHGSGLLGKAHSDWAAREMDRLTRKNAPWTMVAMGSGWCVGLAVLLGAVAAHGADTVRCPDVIHAREAAVTSEGWKVEEAEAEHKFLRISVFNRDAGGREYDLAPDDEGTRGRQVVQRWELSRYRELAVVVRCRYRDTGTTLALELPPALTECQLRFEVDRHGTIVGASTMECR